MDWTSILTALIVSGLPAVVTLITSSNNKKEADKQAKRSNILSLINMDKMNVLEGKLPQNSVLIHEQFDIYKSMGGNSFIMDTVDDYDEWVKKLKVEKGDTMPGCGGKKKGKK